MNLKVCYLKEYEEKEELLKEQEKRFPKWIQKLICTIREKRKKSNIVELNDKIVWILPIKRGETLSDKRYYRIIEKMLKKYPIKEVALSYYCNDVSIIKEVFEKNKIRLLTGKWLYQYLIYETITYICKQKEEKLEKQEISVFIKEVQDIHIQTIILLAKNCKLVNIITQSQGKLRNLETYLYNTHGITIRITNNKKKSLLKSDFIINMNCREEEINKYKFPSEAVFMNIEEPVKVRSNSFQGVIVNDYKIEFPHQHKVKFYEHGIYHNFEKNILYESIRYKKDSFKNIRNEILQDQITIHSLIGNHGIIRDSEFRKISTKELDKSAELA